MQEKFSRKKFCRNFFFYGRGASFAIIQDRARCGIVIKLKISIVCGSLQTCKASRSCTFLSYEPLFVAILPSTRRHNTVTEREVIPMKIIPIKILCWLLVEIRKDQLGTHQRGIRQLPNSDLGRFTPRTFHPRMVHPRTFHPRMIHHPDSSPPGYFTPRIVHTPDCSTP